jgi:hypothetical protein
MMINSIPTEVGSRWSDLVADLEATADEFREAGYETVAVHAGDVTPRADELTLDVLVPDNEFDRLQTLTADATIDKLAVYAATEGQVTFAVIAGRDPEAAVAVCWPVFVTAADGASLQKQALAAGRLEFRLRPLANDQEVRFEMSDPAVLFDAATGEE